MTRVPRRIAGSSLRTRVLVIAIALLAAGQLIGSAVVIGALEHYLVGRVDTLLRLTASVAARIPAASRVRLIDIDQAAAGRVDNLFGNPYLAYLRPDGTVQQEWRAMQQPGAGDPRLPALDRAAVAARDGRPFYAPSDGGSSRWRVLAIPISDANAALGGTAADADGTLVVASELTEVDAAIARLRLILVSTSGGLLVLLTGAGWLAIRAGLRPLRRIEETSAAIARGDLSRRVPELAAPGTEVGRVAAALNSMLDRNEAAFAARAESEARMRRFVADASHELRTPLAGIKGFTKLYRMGAMPQPHDVDDVMVRIEKESDRLTRLVADLLLLAQIDELQHHPSVGGGAADGAFPLHLAPTDLRTLAVDALHDVQALDPSRPVALSGPGGTGAPAAAPALADEARLRQVVTNLVGNAVAHTPAGTPVRIGVGTVDGLPVLEVADRGPGLTAEQARRVFDRFYRADESRSRRAGGGAGLGLAIVQSLVTAHGGRVELSTAPGEGATFRVVLPPEHGQPPDG